MNRPPHRPEEDVYLMPLPDQQRKGVMRHGRGNEPGKRRRIVTISAAIMAVAGIAIGITIFNLSSEPTGPLPVHLPPASESYLGVYTKGLPNSYGPVTAFADATGSKPDVVMYYSGWYVPFPAGFAKTVANHGAVPLVQMDPDGINIAHIASGRYDGYLSSYAEAVRAYGHPVVVSFGHEMNGSWSSWGYRHTPPRDFVAAWQHIVKVFRALDAQNVTWLWTVNIVNDSRSGKVDDNLRQWWPGSSLRCSARRLVRFGRSRIPPSSSQKLAPCRPRDRQRRSLTFSRASAPTVSSDSYGSTPRTSSVSLSVLAAQRRTLRFIKVLVRITDPDPEQLDI